MNSLSPIALESRSPVGFENAEDDPTEWYVRGGVANAEERLARANH
jgi:hypothetical protein